MERGRLLPDIVARAFDPGRLLLGMVTLCYALLLVWCYDRAVSRLYAYLGMRNVVLSPWEYTLAFVCACVPCLWLPLGRPRPSTLVIWLQYLVVYLPTCLIAPRNAAPAGPNVWGLILCMAASMMIIQAIAGLPTIRLARQRLQPEAYRWALVAAFALLLIPIVAAFGVPTSLPSLLDVYGVRSEYQETVRQTGRGVGYAVFWLAGVVAPLLMIEGLVRRKSLPLIMAASAALYLFAVSGMKSVAFSCVLILGLYWLSRGGGKRLGLRLASAVLAVIAVSTAIDLLMGQWLFTNLLVRRVLIVPGLLTGDYYDYFTSHSVTLLSGSFLAFLGHNPYDAPVPVVIGTVYFGSPDMSANVNVWGDAIANFGLYGVIGYAVVLGLILWGFDSAAIGGRSRTAVLMVAMPAFALTNSALPTTIVTGGLGLIFIAALWSPAAEPAPRTPRPAGIVVAGGGR